MSRFSTTEPVFFALYQVLVFFVYIKKSINKYVNEVLC
jgi:hypothetical protein